MGSEHKLTTHTLLHTIVSSRLRERSFNLVLNSLILFVSIHINQNKTAYYIQSLYWLVHNALNEQIFNNHAWSRPRICDS